MKKFLESHWFARMTALLGILVVALIIFAAGVSVGYRKATFSQRWTAHYGDVFGGPGSPFFFARIDKDGDGDFMAASNGAAGKVIAVRYPSVAVKGPNEVEKVVIVGTSTIVRQMRSQGSTTDIRVGDMMTAIGQPDDQGRIVATFVRILPPPGAAPAAGGEYGFTVSSTSRPQ